MPDLSALLANTLGQTSDLARERAVAVLRAGRPLLVETGEASSLCAALDGVSPSTFDVIAGLEGAVLVLSVQRARTLGTPCENGAAIPLAGLELDTAMRLACDPRQTTPSTWREPSEAAAATLVLAKRALLLPAVLCAPLPAGVETPPDLQRYLPQPGDAARPPYALEIISQALVPLANGSSGRFMVFRGGPATRDQVAIVVGDPDPAKPVLVRAHSACLTGDLFGSLRCDCGDQLKNAMARLAAGGGGVLLYLDQEGRGIGIGNKMRAYALQDQGFDTIDADAVLGFGADERVYDYAASILHTLGYRKIILLTNNPEKIGALTRAGIEVVDRQPLYGEITAQNDGYLRTKQGRAHHMLQGLFDPGAATGTD